jgi:hypothetical protein
MDGRAGGGFFTPVKEGEAGRPPAAAAETGSDLTGTSAGACARGPAGRTGNGLRLASAWSICTSALSHTSRTNSLRACRCNARAARLSHTLKHRRGLTAAEVRVRSAIAFLPTNRSEISDKSTLRAGSRMDEAPRRVPAGHQYNAASRANKGASCPVSEKVAASMSRGSSHDTNTSCVRAGAPGAGNTKLRKVAPCSSRPINCARSKGAGRLA